VLRDHLLPALRFDLSKAGAFIPAALFARPVEAVWLEVGFGAGEHLAAQAAAHPALGTVCGNLSAGADRPGKAAANGIYGDRRALPVLP